MSNSVVPNQSSCGGAVELRHTYNMSTTRDRGHCCGVTEGSAEWHRAKQHRIFCIESNAASYVSGMPSDCLLVVQDHFRSAGGSRSGEGQARRVAGGLVRPGIGRSTLDGQHRQSLKRGGIEGPLRCKYTAETGPILDR